MQLLSWIGVPGILNPREGLVLHCHQCLILGLSSPDWRISRARAPKRFQPAAPWTYQAIGCSSMKDVQSCTLYSAMAGLHDSTTPLAGFHCSLGSYSSQFGEFVTKLGNGSQLHFGAVLRPEEGAMGSLNPGGGVHSNPTKQTNTPLHCSPIVGVLLHHHHHHKEF